MKSNRSRLTKKMIRDAYNCGVIHLSNHRISEKLVANIGEDYFYFDIENCENFTAEEYENTFSEEMIVEKLFDGLRFIRDYKYSKDQYNYFREYLFEIMGRYL